MIYIILLLFSFTISSEFNLEDFYLFRDTEQRNLFRANLNLDNTVLSTEILYDGGSELGMNKREIILLGIGDPFYIHTQHIDYEDSRFFGGYINTEFEIALPLDMDVSHIVLMSQQGKVLTKINEVEVE